MIPSASIRQAMHSSATPAGAVSHAASLLAQQKHPLQRLHSPGRGLSLALHLLAVSSFLRSFWFTTAYGSHYQFLTILGLCTALVTCLLGLLADVLLSRRLFRLKNAVAVVSTPLEALISMLYWGLVLLNEDLVKPANGPRIPLAADLGLHAAPTIFLIIDLLAFSPPWTINFATALTTSAFAATGYWFWVEHCFRMNGWYPYPIFMMLQTAQRVGLFGVSALVMAACTLGLKGLYATINGGR
ncbi:hypothetical protein KEM52_001699 [Ascosphaera acerosa]|nr:hypothetical protein KEM52_001699 [Ascosphaera acerosa]